MTGKYLLLYLKTGGGHYAPAASIATFLAEKHPHEIETTLVDGFDKSPRFVRLIVEDGYRYLQTSAQWIYELLYFTNKMPLIALINRALVSFFVTPYIKELILQRRPDKIIIFHFFLIKPVRDVLRQLGLEIPVMTVVTDPFTAHPLWFVEKDIHFIVFSEELRSYCIHRGIAPEHLTVFPFIIDKRYSHPLTPSGIIDVKRTLNIDPDGKVILIMGGADGIPRGERILKEVVRANPRAQIIMVCGRNTRLMRRVTAWTRRHAITNVRIYGFIDFVFELLNVADVVITKGGASMFMQTLMTRKIPVVNNYLWGQEKGNVDFLRQQRIGVYERNTRRIGEIVNEIIDDAGVSYSYRDNIEKAKLENGVAKVSQFIVEFNGVHHPLRPLAPV